MEVMRHRHCVKPQSRDKESCLEKANYIPDTGPYPGGLGYRRIWLWVLSQGPFAKGPRGIAFCELGNRNRDLCPSCSPWANLRPDSASLDFLEALKKAIGLDSYYWVKEQWCKSMDSSRAVPANYYSKEKSEIGFFGKCYFIWGTSITELKGVGKQWTRWTQ